MQPPPTTDGTETATIIVRMPRDPYVRRLRLLGAWWSLGSSALEPLLLIRYAPVALSRVREAGL